MAASIVLESLKKRAVVSQKRTSIAGSLASDAGPLEVKYVKSGSIDFGQANEGSVYIVSVGDGSLNPGFVGDQDAVGDCGLSQVDKVSDRQPNTDENPDKISVMVIGPFTAELTESGEMKLEYNSSGPNQQKENQTLPKTMASPDASKKLSMRDYTMALSIFFITLLTYGNLGCLSVLTVEWLQEFKNSKSLILYVPNLVNALMSAAGVIDNYLITRFGIYKIIILGCFLQVSCIIVSSFSTNAITLVIVLGFLLGFASCFCYLNCFILMGVQFGDAGKSFIAALSVSGPLAGIIFPNLIPFFIEEYTWRGGMFILASLDLQMIPLALFLLLSQKHTKKKQLKDDATTKTETNGSIPLPEPKKAVDVSVSKDPIYIVYVIAVMFTMCGIIVMYGILPSFIHSKGFDLVQTARLYSIYCVISAVPRIFFGLLLRWVKIRYLYIFIVSSCLLGMMFILINQVDSFTTLFVSIIVMSLCMGGPGGLYAIGVLECLGPEKYSLGTSIAETTYGVGTAIFSYLAGVLVEYTDSFEPMLCIFGGAIILSNLCLLITVIVQSWRAKKGFSKF